jgi:hypothetical protein
VAVDLGPRGYLFAILGSARDEPSAAGYASALLRDVPQEELGDLTQEQRIERLRSVKGSVAIRPDAYPTLVRFRDISRPETVEEVDPGDLASAFGSGVALREIKVEITDDRATNQIERILPWLPEYWDRQLDGHRYHDSLAFPNQLSYLSFKETGS